MDRCVLYAPLPRYTHIPATSIWPIGVSPQLSKHDIDREGFRQAECLATWGHRCINHVYKSIWTYHFRNITPFISKTKLWRRQLRQYQSTVLIQFNGVNIISFVESWYWAWLANSLFFCRSDVTAEVKVRYPRGVVNLLVRLCGPHPDRYCPSLSLICDAYDRFSNCYRI